MEDRKKLTEYIRKEYPNLYLVLKSSAKKAKISIELYLMQHLPDEVLMKLKSQDPSLITEVDIDSLEQRLTEGNLREIAEKTLALGITHTEKAKLLHGYIPDIPEGYIENSLPRLIPRLNLGIVSMPTGSGIENYDELLDPEARALVATHLNDEANKLRSDGDAIKAIILDRVIKSYMRRLQLARTPQEARSIIYSEREKVGY
ncbi:hypothetical protein J4216_04615 [Candidatus Woesearchaeota archaeon]|nr:hypothetical protein [Candidatus Woesearchaeota archaeon]